MVVITAAGGITPLASLDLITGAALPVAAVPSEWLSHQDYWPESWLKIGKQFDSIRFSQPPIIELRRFIHLAMESRWGRDVKTSSLNKRLIFIYDEQAWDLWSQVCVKECEILRFPSWKRKVAPWFRQTWTHKSQVWWWESKEIQFFAYL